jgi:2-phosphosulfolactate phosphatase
MEISIYSLLEGATRATGTVAVIDVFRAFTTAAVALANGASRIVMVSTVEEALALRAAGIGQICMGEVRGRVPAGYRRGEPGRAALRGLAGHGRGDCPCPSFGFITADLPRRHGRFGPRGRRSL